ncbi:MAG: cobalamin-dependent protein [Spirochaetales bacterium]|nr:cobalamin-dependent protein [Spirochaetales bacterium]
MKGYSIERRQFSRTFDPTHLRPYGDTMNDGKVQISFTLPVENNDKAVECAKQLAVKMGLEQPVIALSKSLDKTFTFFVVYGNTSYSINYEDIEVVSVKVETMGMKETDAYIKENIGRKIVVVGASTGSDAHTVGIDAIMNMKGYAGHYGLERYEMIEAYNLGSQVENIDFVRTAIELKADVLLVSQTVTQKDIHIQNLTQLVEMIEAEGIREKVVLICGGPRVSHQLAKELGYDAGFGSGKFADDAATFLAKEMAGRLQNNSEEIS